LVLFHFELGELLADADVVSLHLPLGPDTAGLVDVVNEEHLVESLRSGRLAAAGLDVFTAEPLPPGHPLLALSNVVAAPHLAIAAAEPRRVKSVGKTIT